MTDIVNLLGKKLGYLATKTNLLSQNISRGEIPGYKRQDIKPFHDIFKANQVNGTSKGLNIKSNDLIKTNTEITPESEVTKLNEVYLEHQMITNYLKTIYGMLDSVMGTKS